ncbi:MAG: hypothetical protein J1F18_12020 [Lachnospiraceae bacterium]|nr:hypothetical protein [Lachnospiraceae bacterium]
MKAVNKLLILCIGLLCGLWITGCGQDEKLTAYQEDMNTFCEHIVDIDEGMNSIDTSADDYIDQLLSYLDRLEDEVAWMAELETPDQFSAVDSLADEADENMKQAVALYHSAYEAEEYDEVTAQAARQYYERANLRIQYIIMILHGEIPEGEGITYTEENSILGGGYLNQTDDDEAADQESSTDNTESEDNFDTDDTVFYEEPVEDEGAQ